MASTIGSGSIEGLWRFPVKSMSGERLREAEFTELGILGDRAFALIDNETGKVVSAKNVMHFPNFLGCRATFVEQPKPGAELPAVQITLPNRTSVTTDTGDVDRVLSAYFGRDVALSRAAPADVAQPLYPAFLADVGIPSPIPGGLYFDLFPLSVLTTSTLEQLNTLRPESRFDERRFRMNVIVRTPEPGFPENDWIGHEIAMGSAVRIKVALADPRCAMTTLAQDDLPKDADILKTIARQNSLQVGGAGQLPCAGVYAVITVAGTVRTGDNVALLRT